MKRFVPWIIIVLLALAAVGGWSIYQAKQAVEQAVKALGDVDVDVSMQGVELSRGADGHAEWRLAADGAKYAQDSGIVTVERPRIIYYLSDGSGEIAVNATSGEVDQVSGGARLWPDVDIVSGPNRVTAERLNYDSAKRAVELVGSVRLVRPGMTLVAPKVTIDLNTNDINAEGGVESVLSGVALPSPKE